MDDSNRPVLVVAPFRRDSKVLGDMLEGNGFEPRICPTPDQLARELVEDTPPIVVSQEGLTSGILTLLASHLSGQGRWSELPLILLLDREQRISPVAARLRAELVGAKLTFLQRPVRVVELLSAVQSAVTARRRQLQLRDYIDLQTELRHELNHRVKNALANVMAIYHLTKRQSRSLDDFTKAFEGRLSALSRVHSSLVTMEEARDIADVAETVLAPYRSAERNRLTMAGPPARLGPGSAVALALCLHELATNAAKYGSLSVPEGSVDLKWQLDQRESQTVAIIEWIESGGPPVLPPERQGFGTAFIQAAVRGSMRGSVAFDYARTGLRCRFVVGAEANATPVLSAA